MKKKKKKTSSRLLCSNLRVCQLRKETAPVLRANQLTQQREGHFHTEGSLIRSHRSKTAALSSHWEFPFEEKREVCS